MFRITCLVQDESLAPVMKAVAGKVFNLECVPVEEGPAPVLKKTKRKKKLKVNGHARSYKPDGETGRQLILRLASEAGEAGITRADLRKEFVASGRSTKSVDSQLSLLKSERRVRIDGDGKIKRAVEQPHIAGA